MAVGDHPGAEPVKGKAEWERCHEAGLASDRGVGVQSALVMDETSEKRSDEMNCCHVRNNPVRLVGLPICFKNRTAEISQDETLAIIMRR
jgi:hypothetical protein